MTNVLYSPVLLPAKRVLLFMGILLLCLPGCATQKAEHPSPSHPERTSGAHTADGYGIKAGQLFYASGKFADVTGYLERAAKSDFILIGEQHDQALHHLVQARLVEALAEHLKGNTQVAGSPPTAQLGIGLEMFPASVQPTLDTFNDRKITSAQLENAVNWKSVWGFDYQIYKPIFDVAEKYNIPVYGLNISKAALNAAKKTPYEALPEKYKKELPNPVILPTLKQSQELQAFFDKHAQTMQKHREKALKEGMSKRSKIKRTMPDFGEFLRVQSIWDTTMAANACKIAKTGIRPLVIIAGAGHVEGGYGIAYRLHIFNSQAEVLLITPSTRFHRAEDEKYDADMYYYAPL